MDIGGEYAGFSVDAYYSKVNDSISASALSAADVADLPKLGFSPNNSLAATISDNTAFAIMGLYNLGVVKFIAAYEHIQYANPTHPLVGYRRLQARLRQHVPTGTTCIPPISRRRPAFDSSSDRRQIPTS